MGRDVVAHALGRQAGVQILSDAPDRPRVPEAVELDRFVLAAKPFRPSVGVQLRGGGFVLRR